MYTFTLMSKLWLSKSKNNLAVIFNLRSKQTCVFSHKPELSPYLNESLKKIYINKIISKNCKSDTFFAWKGKENCLTHFLLFVYSNLTYSLVDWFWLGGSRKGFSSSSSVSSSITRLGVILCLHFSSLLFKLSFYCQLWMDMA